jgi:multicomponent Na+:H+ antiporter subunit G
MVIVDRIVILIILAGVFVTLAGAIGLLRFPDFYTRLHATGKCDTLGTGLILSGLMVFHFAHYGSTPLVPIKILVLVIFVFIANPTATHAIVKAAYRTGVRTWHLGEKRR